MPDRMQINPRLRIDHVLFMGRDLDAMEDAFERIGIESEYGGKHVNGNTHNSLVGFDDGSYIELISTVESGVESGAFDAFIHGNAGPSGWAVEPNDIRAEAQSLADVGFDVEEIGRKSRETPAGNLAEWEMVDVDGELGSSRIPILITDIMPREHRIQRTESVAGSELTQVGAVLVAVENLNETIELYKRAFDMDDPELSEDEALGMQMAHFPGTAVILAAPLRNSWLTDRLEEFGEGPGAFLLASKDITRSLSDRPLEEETSWFNRRVAWFNLPEFGGKLGVIG